MRICSVDGCVNAHRARGFCSGHWKRWRFGGDTSAPLQGAKATHSEIQIFLTDVVLRHQGNECLEWPYGKNQDGYAYAQVSKKWVRVTRHICEVEHGPPPTSKHEAAHSCGNCSCVSRGHLSWKTPSENAADKVIHGTSARGENSPTSKLIRSQVHEIRGLLEHHEYGEIATQYGVNPATIRAIHKRRTWAWLEPLRDNGNATPSKGAA